MVILRIHAKDVRVLTCRTGEEGAQLLTSAARQEEAKGAGLGWLVKEEMLRFVTGELENPSVELVAEMAHLSLPVAVYVIHSNPSLAQLGGMVSEEEAHGATTQPVVERAESRLAAALPMLAPARIRAIAQSLAHTYS
eukprot:240314-Rhodomonas_salina.1